MKRNLIIPIITLAALAFGLAAHQNGDGKAAQENGKGIARPLADTPSGTPPPQNKVNTGRQEQPQAKETGAQKATSTKHQAQNHTGRIGTFGGQRLDSPGDNVYHIYLEGISGITTAYLTYELYGAKDSRGVSHSINDAHATGGACFEPDTVWKNQKERIPVKQLKQGDNVVRFSALPHKQGYAVRNVGISLGSEKHGDKEAKLTLNSLGNRFSGNTAYINGQLTGNLPTGHISIKANGQPLYYEQGAFFGTVTRNGETSSDGWYIEITASNGQGWETSQKCHYKKAQHAVYAEGLTQDIATARTEATEGDTLTLEAGGAELKLDSLSLAGHALLSISTLREVDVMPTQSGLVNVTGKHFGYRMLPHGQQFNSPVRIGLPYDKSKLPKGYTEKDIRTYYFDENKGAWTALPFDTVDTKNNMAYAYSTHFTDFINGVVQVPESPETQGYTPTSIKGLSVADPTSGIVQISPPTANNTGSANLGFPLKLPPGRKGMSPSLGISYSSAGGNGWLGNGWSLPVPSISVETRWGVPRYDEDLETETYLMGGQLSPVAHRSEWGGRTPDKRFYPRTEGSFSRIIRKGNSPKNYWWEVTTTDGTKYWYGSADGKNVSEGYVLASDEGKIAEWKLAKVVDLNGNTMAYSYQSPTYPSQPLSEGKSLYLSNINYTGHGGDDGNYNVNFILQENVKADARIACNLGFPISDGYLLDRIEIKYNGQAVRSYQLNYIKGAYDKTLLQSVTELDAEGEGFYTNSFEYYNEIGGEGGFSPFKPVRAINTESDDLNGGGLLSLAKSSAIGSHKGWNAGGGLYAGAGTGWNICNKQLTVGGSYSYNHSESKGINTLIDLNGDRLVDKVFIDGDDMYYRPQLKDHSFSATRIKIDGGGTFDKTKSNSHTGGFNAIAYATVGASARVTRSKTENYFSDVNSDGLIDFVVRGKVRYNALGADGHPSFTADLSKVATPTTEGGEIDTAMLMPDLGDWLEQVEENPLNDMVRTWEAPYDGTVSITGDIGLSYPSLANTYGNADGIIASIQVGNGEAGVLWTDSVYSDLNATLVPSGVGNIHVSKGERVYFRLQSRFNGMYDRVNWSPTISYTDKTPKKDINGLDLYSFNANDDYLLSSGHGASLPVGGQVRIASYLEKPETTDDIGLVYVLVGTDGAETIVDTKTFGWGSSYNDSIILENVAVDGGGQRLDIRVVAETEIDWSALALDTKVTYSASNEPGMPLESLGESVFYPVPYFRVFNWTKGAPAPFTVPGNKVVSVSPVIEAGPLFPKAVIDGGVTLSIKRTGKSPAKKEIWVENGLMENDSSISGLMATAGEGLHVGLFMLDTAMFMSFEDSVLVSYVDSSIYAYNVADTAYTEGYLMLENLRPYKIWGDTLYSALVGDTLFIEDMKLDTTAFKTPAGVSMHTLPDMFGANYRHWGQFSYMNGNGKYIDEDDLGGEAPEGINTDVSINEGASYEDQKADFESQTGGKTQIDKAFVRLYPSGETGCWMGYGDSISISPAQMGSGRRGENGLLPYEDLVAQEISEGSGKRALIKQSKTNDYIFRAGVQADAGGFTASRVNTATTVQTDFMDMNGDGFPDLINGSRVQYSSPLGGLSSLKADMDGAPAVSSGTVNGFSVNGRDPETKKNSDSKFALHRVSSIGSSNQATSDQYTLLDINGDGLPDRLYAGDKVRLNHGYGFGKEQKWGLEKIRESHSSDMNLQVEGVGVNIDPETGELKGASAQFSLWQGSFVAGIGASSNNSYADIQLMDVNGDGLADLVTATTGDSPKSYVRLNTGTGFAGAEPWKGINTLNNQYSINTYADVAFTTGFTFMIAPVKIVVNPQVQGGLNFNRTTEGLMDFDGDGHPDYLASRKDNELSFMASSYGKTNLLHRVNNALGSTITLGYEKRGNTFEMPQQAWVLSEVETFDGHTGDGADYAKTSYGYGQGHYDRYERTFYGFDTVTAKQLDTENNDKVYRTIVKTFENGNYHTQGLQLKETLYDSMGNKYTETQNSYMFKRLSDNSVASSAGLPEFSDGSAWYPYLAETKQLFYEGQETAGKTHRNAFEYDSHGNIVKYTDYGDENTGDDVIVGNVAYHSDEDSYIYAIPESIEVTSGGELYRKREADMDGKGQVTEVRSYITTGTYATANLEYDKYGNLEKSTSPKNAKGERMFHEYTFDGETHSYPVKVGDAFGYTSSSEYDYRFGAVLSTTDMNGQPMGFAYDNKGRLTQVTGPKEIENGVEFTIRHSYYPFADLPYALTEHYDPANPDDLIETATFTDGTGRGIQTKKDVAIYQDSLSPAKDMMAVSGHVAYDAFGRAVKAYRPVSEEKGNTGTFNTEVDGITPTITEYDAMGRAVKTTLPDGNESNVSFGFGSDKNGTKQFMATATDPLGNQTVQYADARGLQTSVKMPGDIWLAKEYDPIGQLLKTIDADGNTTTNVFDLLGRRLERNHPDAGKTVWEYDNMGNMTTVQNAHCDQPTTYAYEYGRLTDITYPDNAYNNTHYEYGEPGAGENRAGRIKSVEDGTGAQLFYYGNMGGVTKNVRSVAVPDNGTYAFKTEWRYDAWGRVQQMIYPDGEIVSYAYNSGGTLESMKGEKGLSEYGYVKSILYDKFGQRKYIAYGNGTQTSYEYDPYRRWLTHLYTTTASGRPVQDNSYVYDAVGNILQLANGAEASTVDGSYGGSVTHNYSYDNRYQLTTASGSYTTSGKEHRYTLDMEYGSTGQILRKNQANQWRLADGDWTDDSGTTYDYTYSYNSQKPHIVTSIHNATAEEYYVYQYDASGNNLSSDEPGLETERYILWTEDNRIKAVKSQGNVSHYVYGASGERVLKLHSNSLSISINGVSAGVSEVNDNYTVYPNAYFVLNPGQYTKHFYIGGQRVLSKIGSDNVGETFYQGGASSSGYYEGKQEALESEVGSNMQSFGLTWYRDANGQVPSKYIKNYLLALENGNKVGDGSGGTGSGDIYTGDLSDSLLGSDAAYEIDQYYVHPDHLGSASFITDLNGETYQHVEYLPFGETFVEERNTENDRFAYLYNGKELDEMTGLYYYGARYYDPRDGIFLGVDPLAEKYANISPYAYCFNNPIRYIDPDGRKVVVFYLESGIQLGAVFGIGAAYQQGFAIDDFGETYFTANFAGVTKPRKEGTWNFGANIDVVEGAFAWSPNIESFDGYMKQSALMGSYGIIDAGTSSMDYNEDRANVISGGFSIGAGIARNGMKIGKSYSFTESEIKHLQDLAFYIDPSDGFDVREQTRYIDRDGNGEFLPEATHRLYIRNFIRWKDSGIDMVNIHNEQWESVNYNKLKNEKQSSSSIQ